MSTAELKKELRKMVSDEENEIRLLAAKALLLEKFDQNWWNDLTEDQRKGIDKAILGLGTAQGDNWKKVRSGTR